MSPSGRLGGFEGDLEALSVVELVQTLALGGKTARLLVRSDSRRGELWFKDGEITHAVAGSVFGDLAVYVMIEWTSGQFFVDYGLSSEDRSITQDATYLVLEGLRRFDEQSAERSSAPERVEVPPVYEADARNDFSRRLALGVIAVGVVAGAIVTAVLRDRPLPAATDVVAAVTAVAPTQSSVAREAPPKPPPAKRLTASPPVLEPKAIVAELPPVVAPESPAAEEPVPLASPVAHLRTPDDPVVQINATDESPRLHISGKSGADGGSLTVLVDGKPAYTHERLDRSEPFQVEIVLTPGEHLIVARLEDGAKAGVHEDSTRSVFTRGESRSLHITANRTFGSPVKVKLGRISPQG